MKQLSDCCKAEIKLTGKDRPNAFSCSKCGRIIGTPINKSQTEGKGIKTTEIELLRQEIAMLKNALCTCPNNGTFVGCPIHGEKMYGDEWRFIDHKKL